jgi:queuine tRNA-ribosyltransferase
VEPDLREKSAREIVALDFAGHAVGGLAVGEGKPERERVLDLVVPMLPEPKPRYLMGVGTPEDILGAVRRGIDLFDCVLPTRNARNGQLFTRRGRLSIRNARFRDDPRPPDPDCRCPTCRSASRAYLRHLHLSGEIVAASLLTIHNLAFYLDTLRRIRDSIHLGRFEEFYAETLRTLGAGSANGH